MLQISSGVPAGTYYLHFERDRLVEHADPWLCETLSAGHSMRSQQILNITLYCGRSGPLSGRGSVRSRLSGQPDPYVKPEEIREVMRDDTALVVIGHGSNVLGSVQDIETIGNLVRKSGAFFLVDGAQTAGQYPVEPGHLPVDAFVFTGHKSLFGLPGTGGFYIRNPEQVDPVRQGGTGVDSAGKYQPEEMPMKFETGTPNYPGIAALNAGTGFVRRKGVDTILSQSAMMTSFLVKELGEIEGVRLYNPSPDLPVINILCSKAWIAKISGSFSGRRTGSWSGPVSTVPR